MGVLSSYKKSSRCHGSALIMVISLLVLLTTIAITFLELVGRQYNSTIGVAAQVKAEIAVQQAQAHLIRCFNKSAANPTKKTDGKAVNYTSYANHQWRREFGAVTDPDGNPFTDTVDYPDGDPMQGQPLSFGSKSTGMPSTTMVSSSPIVNADVRLFDLMDVNLIGTVDMLSRVLGHAEQLNGKRQTWSRWHNIEYLDAEFKTIEIDDSKSPEEKADIRRSSRYVLRYTAQALDLSGMHTINNNFPHELNNKTIDRGSGSTDDEHYIRYQNYLKAYGRSLKSMRAAVRGGKQVRASHSFDPLDNESVATNVEVGADGMAKSALKTGNVAMRDDWRLVAERAFRDGDLNWSARYGGNFAPLSYGLKGRVQTWSHLRTLYRSNKVYADNFFLAPWGLGMLDEALSGGAAADADPVSTPWKINLMSATNLSARAMVYGLHSHLKVKGHWNQSLGADLEAEAHSTRNRIHSTDLLGRNHPEPFPLSLDSGRNVPLAGTGGRAGAHDLNGCEQSSAWKRSSLVADIYQEFATVGTRHSYVHDIAAALQLAMDDARRVWDEEKDPWIHNERVNSWGSFLYRGSTNPSTIKPVDGSTSKDEMLKIFMNEVYRILGEGKISGDNPAVSTGSYNRAGDFDPNGRTLLAGGGTLVGVGNAGTSSDGVPIACRGDYEIFAELEPGANTRAMEYVLNDIMISLFGKANPDYVIGSKDYPNIAVDFNGDSKAESTVTGWWDPSPTDAGAVQTWSWWWDGLGPYVKIDVADEYMKKDGWYRFAGGKLLRKISGDSWEEITNTGNFFTWNDIWLTGNMTYPIKPFAKTGRFYIGKSKLMNGFIRGEVYDITNKRPLAVADRYFVYRIDPNDDNDHSDNHVIIQTDDRIEKSNYR